MIDINPRVIEISLESLENQEKILSNVYNREKYKTKREEILKEYAALREKLSKEEEYGQNKTIYMSQIDDGIERLTLHP